MTITPAIKEAHQKREEMCKAIAKAIIEFEQATGLTVKAVDLERQWILTGGRHSVVTGVTAEIVLEDGSR